MKNISNATKRKRNVLNILINNKIPHEIVASMMWLRNCVKFSYIDYFLIIPIKYRKKLKELYIVSEIEEYTNKNNIKVVCVDIILDEVYMLSNAIKDTDRYKKVFEDKCGIIYKYIGD